MTNLIRIITLVPILLFSQVILAQTNISINDAKSYRFKNEIGTVFISQPKVADYKVISDKELVIFGIALGEARVMVYDSEGNMLRSSLVRVVLPLDSVRQEVRKQYPELDISIDSVGDKISIKGVVYNEKQRDDIYALVAGLLGKKVINRWTYNDRMTFSGEETSIIADPKANFYRNFSYEDLIEGLEIRFPYQVNVKTTIAQVSSDFNEIVGIDWKSGTTAANGVFYFYDLSSEKLSSVINALSDDSLGEVLAEPNLTVLSGEEASFLVGGEIPLVTTQDDTITFTYKEYGIGLDLSAKVLSDEKIRLRLNPSVINVEDTIQMLGSEIPLLGTRRISTTVEVADGQTFMIGGLLSTEDIEQLRKIPFLGDIPLLGSLFRTATTTRKRTELVVIVTVSLVKPTAPNDLQIPIMEKSHTYQRWLGIESFLDSDIKSQKEAQQWSKDGGLLE